MILKKAVAVGATIYFGSAESDRQITEIARLFEEAHSLGMVTALWCYLRNRVFKRADADYHLSTDLPGQANYLGVTIQADMIKQKLPVNNGGYKILNTEDITYKKKISLCVPNYLQTTQWIRAASRY